MSGYPIPAKTIRIETRVVNSRFIATAGRAARVDEAKAFIASIRAEMPDASHHVHAFKVGYGSSVIEGMTDDSEPSGTAGPPVLAILRGADIGDTVIVVTRYFGGTKLGTGGLVRAYSDAARQVLTELPRELLIPKALLGIEIDYSYHDQLLRILSRHEAEVEDREFAAAVTLYICLPSANIAAFSEELQTLTAGQVQPVLLEER